MNQGQNQYFSQVSKYACQTVRVRGSLYFWAICLLSSPLLLTAQLAFHFPVESN